MSGRPFSIKLTGLVPDGVGGAGLQIRSWKVDPHLFTWEQLVAAVSRALAELEQGSSDVG